MTPPPPPPPRGRGRAGDDDLEHVLRRSRRRRDRTRGKRKRRTTLIFVVLLVIVLAVIASGVGAVAQVPLRLRPEGAEGGPDRRELVRLRRQRLAARRDPGRAQPHAGRALARQPVDEQGDGRDRGPPLLRARRRRLRGHRARGLEGPQRRPRRPGRLDDHAAARPQPLHLEGADAEAEAEGGLPRDPALARALEGLDPRPVHEPGLLRQPRLRDRGRGARPTSRRTRAT